MLSVFILYDWANVGLQPDDVDSRVVGELNRLPEHQALSVLKEFSMADQSNVRSKSGYILGISRNLAKPRGPGLCCSLVDNNSALIHLLSYST